MKLILVLFLSIQACFAQQMVTLEKGQEAPFSGVLSDYKQMREFRQINEEKKLLEKKVVKLESLSVKQEQLTKIAQEEADHNRQLYRKEQISSTWAKVLYFSLGVVATGLAAKVAIESSR